MIKCKLRKNLFTVFLHALVWLIIVYRMKGRVTCYIKKCWVMGLCRPSDITTINLSQSCVKLYECTKFGTNIVGEMCTNSVTWFCAYLCKTEDTVNYACCNIWCTTCSLLWPLSADISKSAQVFIFCFKKKNPGIVHILKTQLVSMYHQLYFLPPLSCFHAHLLALSHIYIYIYNITLSVLGQKRSNK